MRDFARQQESSDLQRSNHPLMVLRSVDGQELKSSSVPPSRQHPVASGNRPMTTAGGAASMNDNRSAIDADDLWRRGYRQVRVFHHHHHYHVLVKPKASHGGGSRLRPKACASSPSVLLIQLTLPSLSGQESVSAILRKGGRLVYCSQHKVSKVEPRKIHISFSYHPSPYRRQRLDHAYATSSMYRLLSLLPCVRQSSLLSPFSRSLTCPTGLRQLPFQINTSEVPPAALRCHFLPRSRTQSTATCLICCGSLPASSSSSGICPPCENAVIASTDLQDSSPPTSTGTKAETPACWVCMGLDPRDATGLCTTCEGAVAGPDLHMTQQHLPNEQLARRINFEGKSGGGSKIGAIRAPSPSRTAVVFPMRPRILW